MKSSQLIICAALLITLCGCDDSHQGAGDDEGIPAKMCGFKENHGVYVNDEVRRALGLATVEVTSQTIPQSMPATARVFAPGKASILVDTNTTGSLKAGHRVLLDGKHEATIAALANGAGYIEAIIDFDAGIAPIGAHLAASFQTDRKQTLPAVPESSLLAAATGDYVFVVNGQHFLRTPVKVAGRADGWVTLADGLIEGDIVVANGVAGLWCIELQATKGGYACCAVAKKE